MALWTTAGTSSTEPSLGTLEAFLLLRLCDVMIFCTCIYGAMCVGICEFAHAQEYLCGALWRPQSNVLASSPVSLHLNFWDCLSSPNPEIDILPRLNGQRASGNCWSLVLWSCPLVMSVSASHVRAYRYLWLFTWSLEIQTQVPKRTWQLFYPPSQIPHFPSLGIFLVNIFPRSLTMVTVQYIERPVLSLEV